MLFLCHGGRFCSEPGFGGEGTIGEPSISPIGDTTATWLITTIPEPGTIGLLALGLGTLAGCGRVRAR